jgi:hypothetical protein
VLGLESVSPDRAAGRGMAGARQRGQRCRRATRDQQAHALGRKADELFEPFENLPLDVGRGVVPAGDARVIAAANASAKTDRTTGGPLTQPAKRG